jgi:hypothetical protein
MIKVGSRVAMQCDLEKKYCEGTITRERDHKKRYFLEYDDGEAQEWIDFRKQKFKLLKRKRGRPKKIKRDSDKVKEIPRGKGKY